MPPKTKEEYLAKLRARKRPGSVRPSVSLKKALKVGHGEVAAKQPEVVLMIKKKLLENRPDKISPIMKGSLIAKENAIAEHLAGESQDFVNAKYHVDVQHALRMYFPNSAQREQVLEDVLLDNALISNVIFQRKASDLSARDAALASGIYTQRFSELKKARKSDHNPEVPVATVILLQQTLERVKQVHGRVIELEE